SDDGYDALTSGLADLGLRIMNNPTEWGPAFAAMAHDHGAPADVVTFFDEMRVAPDWWHLVDPPHETVSDGDTIPIGDGRSLEVIYTPGHEIAHICLKDSTTGVLFSGDHVLPRITPYVGFEDPERDPNPLGNFMASLQRIVDGDHGVTYPAHGDIVERGSARAEQIILHHERRLNDTMGEIVDPATAWDVMGEIFRPNLDLFHKRLALRETLSHLELLVLDHRAHKGEEHGLWHYRRSH
ncbi:MAG: MBL fold metallo-hydrolase, partial [Acidimicrobiia bacterium]|nr:MBL fold metallo-hydrolase [Acidimicrobiia bacterium]